MGVHECIGNVGHWTLAAFTREFYPVFNSLPVANRVPIHRWMWVESTRITIRVGGVHTGSGSELNPD